MFNSRCPKIMSYCWFWETVICNNATIIQKCGKLHVFLLFSIFIKSFSIVEWSDISDPTIFKNYCPQDEVRYLIAGLESLWSYLSNLNFLDISRLLWFMDLSDPGPRDNGCIFLYLFGKFWYIGGGIFFPFFGGL